MPRRLRKAAGGVIYHVLNRAAGRNTIFEDQADYAAFEKALAETCTLVPGMAVLAYCVMPNHWHLVLRPRHDHQLSDFLRRLTVTHTQRRHAHHHTRGSGPLYQGRFKSFPVQQDAHLRVLCRYVERNAVRARLSKRARDWRWCSPGQRKLGGRGDHAVPWLLLPQDWPIQVPRNWEDFVDRAETDKELAALRNSVKRGAPFGSERWVKATAGRFALESSLRPPHRPRRNAATARAKKKRQTTKGRKYS